MYTLGLDAGEMGGSVKHWKQKGRQKVMDKLGMTEKNLKNDVEDLKCWLQKTQPPSNLEHLDLDIWIENHLIMAKNNLEKTRSNLEKYFRIRTLYPHMFIGRDVTEQSLIQSYETMTISYIPGLTDRLHKVCIVRLEDKNTNLFNFESHFKRCLMAVEYYLKEGIDFTGFHVVIDLKNFKLSHLSSLRPSLLKFVTMSTKAYPISFAVINIINYPSSVAKIIALFKPFISSKLSSRIVLIKDINVLKEVVGSVQLPSDYCPSNGTLSQKEYSEIMKGNFLKNREYINSCDRVNAKSWNNKNAASETFGSFRTLTID